MPPTLSTTEAASFGTRSGEHPHDAGLLESANRVQNRLTNRKTRHYTGFEHLMQALYASALDQFADGPRLGTRKLARILDLNHVTLVKLVVFIVGMILFRQADHLADNRMLHAALNQNRDRLVHLVAHHTPRERAHHLLDFSHARPAFSRIMVLTRAISRRSLPKSAVLLDCWVATCIRNAKWARNSDSSSCFNSAAFLPRISFVFITQLPIMRVTKVVAIGSLAAAKRNASRASDSFTPSISYNTLPGWISAT